MSQRNQGREERKTGAVKGKWSYTTKGRRKGEDYEIYDSVRTLKNEGGHFHLLEKMVREAPVKFQSRTRGDGGEWGRNIPSGCRVLKLERKL